MTNKIAKEIKSAYRIQEKQLKVIHKKLEDIEKQKNCKECEHQLQIMKKNIIQGLNMLWKCHKETMNKLEKFNEK